MRKILKAACFTFALLCLSPSAHAEFQYGFTSITNWNATNVSSGESQLGVTVSDASNGRVRFEFDNVGANDLSITNIYFDDRAESLFEYSVGGIENGTGTSFREGGWPWDLTGGSSVGFSDTHRLAANFWPSMVVNGVNPGETVGVLLNLATGHAFADVLEAINTSALRIGVYVSGFSNGGSESFVNSPATTEPPVVPEPSGLSLFGIAAVGLLLGQRWQRRRQQA